MRLLLPGAAGLCTTPLHVEGTGQVLRTVNSLASKAAMYRRTHGRGRHGKTQKGGGRGPADNPSAEHSARRQRVRLMCRDMFRAVCDRPEADQALAINELIKTFFPRSTRLLLRELSFVERERYVGIRSAIADLGDKFWTHENWLELRLTKYIAATGVFKLGHKLFSMLQSRMTKVCGSGRSSCRGLAT